MVRTKHYKLIRNLAFQLDDPATRQYHSTWQGVLKSGRSIYGKRPLKDCIHHQEYELYDLDHDPYEIVNLSNSDKYASVFNELKQKLDSFQRATLDPWAKE
jgi:N-sulfoglucosamine sulfohydrolase